MSLNVYIGATIMLVVAVAGMMAAFFALRNRKSKLWLAPMIPLSTTVFVAVFMYFMFADSRIVISPWVAILYVFAELGALFGCYLNENLEEKPGMIKALVIVLSIAMFIGLVATLMLSFVESIALLTN